jgi:hypothetical protein
VRLWSCGVRADLIEVVTDCEEDGCVEDGDGLTDGLGDCGLILVD